MRTSKLMVPILLFVALIFQGCSSAKNVSKDQLQDKWILKSMNNRDVNQLFTEKTPYIIINFNLNQISGNAGCNSFNGRFTYNGGLFHAPNIVSTMMACDGMQNETEFLKILGVSSKLNIVNGELIFTQKDIPVLKFSRAQPLTATDLTGVWKLQSLEGSSVSPSQAGVIPTLEFNFTEGRIHGNAGCNTYNANFTLERNVLEVTPLITTRMTCDKIDQETKFVKLFTGRIDLDLTNGQLQLRKDNKILMTFAR
ncbi:MAG: META domain-containing protein [Dysgonomonas sp.]